MALIQCKECGKQVSSKAEQCPQCGVKLKKKGIGLVGFVVIVVSGMGMVSALLNPRVKSAPPLPQSAETQPAPAAAPSTPQMDEATCRKDLQCWGDRNTVAAGVYCKQPVEKLAQYSVRWTDGWIEPKFGSFRWLNKEQGQLTFIGDKAEFQNGFGAFQTYVYECDFDPASKAVLAVRARPGHL